MEHLVVALGFVVDPQVVVDPQDVCDVSRAIRIDAHECFGMAAASERHAPADVAVVAIVGADARPVAAFALGRIATTV